MAGAAKVRTVRATMDRNAVPRIRDFLLRERWWVTGDLLLKHRRWGSYASVGALRLNRREQLFGEAGRHDSNTNELVLSVSMDTS
jgi:hypothetical protein